MDDSAHVQNGWGIVQSTTQKGIGPDSELRMPYVLRYLLCVKFLTDIISLNTTTHQVAQMVKCLPAVQKTWVWSLGWEDPLEKEMATHSSTVAWKIPWMEEPARLQSTGSQRVTQLSDFTFTFFHLMKGLWHVYRWENWGLCRLSPKSSRSDAEEPGLAWGSPASRSVFLLLCCHWAPRMCVLGIASLLSNTLQVRWRTDLCWAGKNQRSIFEGSENSFETGRIKRISPVGNESLSTFLVGKPIGVKPKGWGQKRMIGGGCKMYTWLH